MKDSSDKEDKNSNAIANQPAQLQSKGAALAAPSQVIYAPLQLVEDEEPLQGKFATTQLAKLEEPVQGKFGTIQKQSSQAANNTGMPDQLKSGIEGLSGLDVSDVKVHYNSSKPAQLNAHAYAQGSDIHIAPGQEKHLPHEAWHTVQQKQGRVQPTAQLKGKVSINDDASLEKEADVMGERALNSNITNPETFIQRRAVEGLKQLQKDNGHEDDFVMVADPEEFDEMNDLDDIGSSKGIEDFDVTEDVDELSDFDGLEDYDKSDDFEKVFEHENAAKREAGAKTMSAKDLAAVKGSHGGDRKIETSGELTTSAKIAGFFNRESTYSKFLKKAAEFNETYDVLKKQACLKELKPLAREWLTRHEENVLSKKPEAQDENELKKLATINKFLRQTTTNFPDVVKTYREALTNLQAFRLNPYDNRLLFQKAHEVYLLANKKFDHYNKTYPPAVNLLYVSEMEGINTEIAHLKPLAESDAKAIGFNTDLGFKLNSPTVNYSLTTGSLSFTGQVEFTIPGVEESEGTVTTYINKNGTFKKIDLSKSSCLAEIDEQPCEVKEITYSLTNQLFFSNSVSSQLKLLGTLFEVNINKVVFDKAGSFDYGLLKGHSSELFKTKEGIEVSNPRLTSYKGEAYEIRGELSALPWLENVKGVIAIDFSNSLEITNVRIKNGRGMATFSNDIIDTSLKLDVNGFSYNHEAGTMFLKEAFGKGKFLGTQVEATALSLKRSKDGEYTYDTIKASSTDTFDTKHGVKVTNPRILAYKGIKYDLRGELGLEMTDVLDAQGQVVVTLDENKNLSNIKIKNGRGTALFNNETTDTSLNFDVNGFSYNYEAGTLFVKEALGKGKLFGTQAEASVTSLRRSKDGEYTYEIIKASSNDTFDTKLGIKITNPRILAYKGMKYDLRGELVIDMPDFANAKGQVAATLDEKKDVSNIKIKNGRGTADFLGLHLNITGFSYDHSSGTFFTQEAKGSTNILGQTLEVSAKNIKRTNEGKYDYSEISASATGFDYEYFSLKDITLSRKKDETPIEGQSGYTTIGSAKYKIKEGALSSDFASINSEGTAAIEWNPGGETVYSITDGDLDFDLLGQKVNAKKFSYNSKDGKLTAKTLLITVNAFGINKILTGKDIGISKEGLAFTELSVDASGNAIENIPFLEIVPSKYSLIYDKEKGYGVQAEGEAGIKANGFGIKANGSFIGGLSYHFKSGTPDYYIKGGELKAEMANPLAKINELFGGNWSSSRFEISAGIPVFPGISAVFGLYIAYGAELGNKPFEATLAYNNETKKLVLNTKALNFNAFVEGGVFGGIQVGSPLLISLALLLRAAGKFEMNVDLSYRKSYQLNDEPSGDQPEKAEVSDAEGLTYSINGELSIGAYLDLVATALYFFEKRFSLELGKKSLGKFEFTNLKNDEEGKPQLPEGDGLADREDLDKHVDPDKKAEAKKVKSIDELLDIKQNYRFSADEKKDVIKTFEKAEQDRATAHQIGKSGETDASGRKKTIETTDTARKAAQFNDVPLQNLLFFSKFIDNRCDWDKIFEVVFNLETIDQTMDDRFYIQRVREDMTKLSESINLASAFVTHFGAKVIAFEAAYPEYRSITSKYIVELKKKLFVLVEVEKFKKNHLHSKQQGDDVWLENWLNSESRLFGLLSTKLQTLSESYKTFRDALLVNGYDADYLEVEEKIIVKNMAKKHIEMLNKKSTR